jgi:putative ABC transport system permease protein
MPSRIVSLFRNLLRKRTVEKALDDELQAAVELLTEENMKEGRSRPEARRQALIELGGVEQVKEEVRAIRLGRVIDNLVRDLRFALRTLAKSPGLTAIVVITLALGTGVNTAIFGIVNGMLLRPLPVRAPEQVMFLAAEQKGAKLQTYTVSYLDLADYRKQVSTFSDLFAYEIALAGLSADGRADEIAASYVTGNYFSALGLKPTLGRLFLPGEGEKPGEAGMIVLGYSYWQKRFGGNPGVVGKQVLMDGKPAVIVGVGPKGFGGMDSALEMDGYLPLNRAPGFGKGADGYGYFRGVRLLRAFGRLNPGISLAQAQSSFDVVAARLAQQYPAADKGITVRVVPEKQARPDPTVASIIPLVAGSFLALAALVLLVACMNVANILLVRATARQGEMGIRAALGAARGRLIAQVLTECTLLALMGGAAGVILGQWANNLLGSTFEQVVSNVPLRLDWGLDWGVFAYALGIAIFTGMIVGVSPALRASRTNVNVMLRESGRSDSPGAGRHRVRNILVVAQIAGSLVLLIAAGLFVRSLANVQRMSLGFDPDHVLNVTLDPHGIGYDEPRTRGFYRELEARVRALPGVKAVALAFSVPMGNVQEPRSVYIEGHPLASGEQPPHVLVNRVDPQYFETMRIPLLRGRGFAETDNQTRPRVAIVNQKMAKTFWPNEDPIGKRFSIFGSSGPFAQVVGVAGDAKYIVVALEEPVPFCYLPYAQDYSSMMALQIRSSVPPESLVAPVREVISGLAPDLPIYDVRTMEQSLGGINGFFAFRMGATLAAVMGLIGLTLAVVGVYGVVSYSAEQSTHEIGIRMALGAGRREILSLILRQGMGLVMAGVLSGLVASWALTRTVARLLVGVSATDPLTFAGATLLLAAIALWACYVPASRALRLDPLAALRYE